MWFKLIKLIGVIIIIIINIFCMTMSVYHLHKAIHTVNSTVKIIHMLWAIFYLLLTRLR